MADREFGFETLALHAGQIPDAATGARVTPIYQTTSFVFDDADHAASLFNLQTFGNIYTRLTNPTTAVFEERVAALEGGRAAIAVGSGMSAQMITLLTLLQAGDHLVSSKTLYGGTYTQFDVTFRRLGIDTTFVDPDDIDAFAAAITPRTKALFAETLGNPLINVLDIEAVADVAGDAGLPLILDNTFPTPYLCRPMEFGADIVVHSATKFLGGHGTSMGGVLVESGKFPWDNGNFPMMTEPSEGYHGVRFYETFGDFGFTMKARVETLRTLGPALSPFNAFLFLQGLETLPLRMERHCDNALAVAKFLHDHAAVEWVRYPSLEDDQYYALAQKYVPRGASAIMSFGIKGGQASGVKFIEGVQFLSHLANVGDAKTLIIHPASTTHRQMSDEQQLSAGITPDMVRISVGLETLDDILWDLDQALARAVHPD
ncbi:MAG: O-acetylhomoserine aminocarboxypropyltransferase/cysteine synthase [Proteobacteria bacterium]|nr:MAG: O-acetylhomoserine aminocarboxypropyltransferase/cysteine synthase [Pseudomonadota bacterium]